MEYYKNLVQMTYRKVDYLTESVELKRFIEKYNLKTKIVDDQKLYLVSNCYIFEVYGLVIEDFFYFHFYSIDLEFGSTLNVLLSDFDSLNLRSVYEKQVNSRTKVSIPKLQGNEKNTLKSEQYFFTMLELMDELLTDVLNCEKNIKQEHLSAVFEFKKNQLKAIFENL